MIDPGLPAYPVVVFLVRWGGVVAVLAGLAPVMVAGIFVHQGANTAWLLAGLGGGVVLWLFVRSYVEVLRILADALMPR